jgi:hypothetical protein
MAWTPLPVETDEDAVTTRILEALAARLPGWVPVEGAPEVALAEEIGRETAATNARAGTAVELAFAGIGETVFGLPALLGAQATMLVELTVTGAGAVVPEGFIVVGVSSDGVEVAFELPEQVTAAAATVQVMMRARDVGTLSNTVPIGPLTVVTATSTVSAAAAVEPSSGGVDAESLTTYLGRLVDYIATLRPGGVRARDLATLARNVTGVHRALGVDLYDPTIPSTTAERTVTVFPIDVDGLPVPAGVAAEVQQVLEDVREVNFVIHVDEPTYTAVQVAFEAVAESGADPVLAQANIHAALAAHLSPARWGSSAADPTTWTETTTVRYLDLARVAGSAEGVAYLTSLTLNGGTADVVLSGPASLPAPLTGTTTPSTITGTVA